MVSIRDCAIAVCFLEGAEAQESIRQRFSEENRNLFYDWFIKEWDDVWDQEMIDKYLDIIGDKINELKGI